MEPDELLEIAEEAAMNVADMDVPLRAYLRAALAAVAPLIAAAERERCTKVAVDHWELDREGVIADAIRAQGDA